MHRAAPDADRGWPIRAPGYTFAAMKLLRASRNPGAHGWAFVLGVCCLLALSARSAPWYRNALVGMEVGPTGAQFGHSDTNDARYCARFDGRQIVRQAVATNSEYLVLWVRDGIRDGDFAAFGSGAQQLALALDAEDRLDQPRVATLGATALDGLFLTALGPETQQLESGSIRGIPRAEQLQLDRKSTRLNSSHT